jgi:predicted outer membrane protein
MRLHIMTLALLLAPGATLMAQDTSATQMPQRDTIRGFNAPQNTSRDTLQSDNALVMKIHRVNQMEIKAGQLAQQNSSTARVKSYGQQLVRDHQAADQKLTTLAQRLGVTLRDKDFDAAGQQGRDTTMRQRSDTLQGRSGLPTDTLQGRSGLPADTTQGRYGQRDEMQGKAHGHDGMQDQEHAQMQRLSTLRGAQFDAEFANFMAQGHDKVIKMLQQAQSTTRNAELRTYIQNALPTVREHLRIAQSLGGSTTTTATSSSQ